MPKNKANSRLLITIRYLWGITGSYTLKVDRIKKYIKKNYILIK